MNKSFLEKRGRALEEVFFANKNHQLLDQLRLEIADAESRAALRAATGFDDDAVLERILALGVHAECLVAMSIVPSVLVAWADGKVDEKERKAVMAAAERFGFRADSAEHALLANWLTDEPDKALRDAWRAYTGALCQNLAADDQVRLKEQVLKHCRQIAEAAGGFLGLGSISRKEQATLDEVKSAFEPAGA